MTGSGAVTPDPDDDKRIALTARPPSLSGRARAMVHAGQAKVISLPGGHQWALRRIEKSLLASDLQLESQFTIFWRSTRLDAMPSSEHIPAGPWPRRAVLLTTAGLALVALRLMRAHSGGTSSGPGLRGNGEASAQSPPSYPDASMLEGFARNSLP